MGLLIKSVVLNNAGRSFSQKRNVNLSYRNNALRNSSNENEKKHEKNAKILIIKSVGIH